MKNDYLENHKKEDCYGCSICAQKCPNGAITMDYDEKGFQYPVLDRTRCTECGICAKVCPRQIKKHTKTGKLYAVEHKNSEVVKKSQSGGVFTALSDWFLQNGGVVYGSVLNENMEAVHIRAVDENGRNKMRGSKYVQSRITPELLNMLGKDIEEGKKVFFSGTPCQCASVAKNYGENKNIVICDFICHGVPSPNLWKDYLVYCEEKFNKKVQGACFRIPQHEGKGHHTEAIYMSDEFESIAVDYATLFYTHLAHRESCFSCQFADMQRCSDITIGGFLDYGKDGIKDSLGVSMCFLNSKKAEEIFERIKEDIVYENKEIVHFKNQPCLYHAVEKPNLYDDFWEDYHNDEFKDILAKYATDEVKSQYHLNTGGGIESGM